jgi:DNA processing protein
MIDYEKICTIALTLNKGIGPVSAKALIRHFGSAEDAIKAKKKDIITIAGLGEAFLAIYEPETYLHRAEEEYAFAMKHGIDILTYKDARYPKRLTYFESCPVLLYSQGGCDLNHHRTVAIVGTRTPTDYGKIMVDRLLEGLKSHGIVLISGLAFGVDGSAHRYCVQHGIETVGCLGHGLDIIYPSSHASLAKKMIQSGGGLLTEFPTNTRPDRENFPMRNRVIAALSDVIIVIESKRSGGSIITADFGYEYKKDVFALPGAVTSEASEGCNNLIKQGKAHLIETADDVAQLMRWNDIDAGKVIQKQLFVDLEDDEQIIFDLLKQHQEIAIDALTYDAAMSPSQVSSLLLALEFKGIVKSLPGKKYGLA